MTPQRLADIRAHLQLERRFVRAGHDLTLDFACELLAELDRRGDEEPLAVAQYEVTAFLTDELLEMNHG